MADTTVVPAPVTTSASMPGFVVSPAQLSRGDDGEPRAWMRVGQKH